jgi:hypothetical protein
VVGEITCPPTPWKVHDHLLRYVQTVRPRIYSKCIGAAEIVCTLLRNALSSAVPRFTISGMCVQFWYPAVHRAYNKRRPSSRNQAWQPDQCRVSTMRESGGRGLKKADDDLLLGPGRLGADTATACGPVCQVGRRRAAGISRVRVRSCLKELVNRG